MKRLLQILPGGWVERPLKQIAPFLRRGKSPKYSETNQGLLVVNQNCIRWDMIDFTKVKYHQQPSDIAKEFYLQKGDILVNSTGTGTIGRINQWFYAEINAVADSHVTIIRCSHSEVDSQYTRYFLSSEVGQRYLEAICYTGSTNQIELSKRYLTRLKLPCPPNLEQKAIAGILSKVDEAIEAVENSIKAAERLKKSLMQNLLTGKLKPDGTWRSEDEFYIDEKFGKVPKGWTIKRIKDLTIQITDGVHSTPNYQSTGIPFLSVTDLKGDRISFKKCKFISKQDHEILIKRCKPENGDILMGKVATLGVCDIVNTEQEFSIFVQIALLKPNREIVGEFLKYIIQGNSFRNILHVRAAGTTIKYIGIASIGKIKVVIPELKSEQINIAEKLNKSHSLICTKKQKIQTLKTLKKSLMQNLLTGKVRVDVDKINTILAEVE